MFKTKSGKKTAVAVAVLLILAAAAVAVFLMTKPITSAGSKNISVSVVLPDQEASIHDISTRAEFLAEVLAEEKLVPKQDLDAGFVTTIDGITANPALEQWWMVTVNGEFSNYGINECPVIDGDIYAFILTEGWDS